MLNEITKKLILDELKNIYGKYLLNYDIDEKGVEILLDDKVYNDALDFIRVDRFIRLFKIDKYNGIVKYQILRK